MPSEEVHVFVNELVRPIGTHLCGRRLYEVMVFWEDLDLADEPPVMREFAEIWRAANKIVYSKTVAPTACANTRIEAEFAVDRIRDLKRSLDSDISVGGAHLAGQALAAGLVDELHQFLSPVIVGGGKHFLPADLTVSSSWLTRVDSTTESSTCTTKSPRSEDRDKRVDKTPAKERIRQT